MKEKPIIFSGAMVRAILDGRKTQTRRVIKPQPPITATFESWFGKNAVFEHALYPVLRKIDTWSIKCPYEKNQRLWVRESFFIHGSADGGVYYRTDEAPAMCPKWKSSIHMPRWASRITLQIESMRVERVQDISGRDVLAEGIDNGSSNPTMGKRWENMQQMAFQSLWDYINAKRGFGWEKNPWVWVIEFKKIDEKTKIN